MAVKKEPISDEQLPKGWEWKTLGDLCSHPQYGWTTSASNKGAIKLLRTTDISSGIIDWASVPFCLINPTDVKKYLLKEGDILVSRAGSVGFSIEIKTAPKAVFASYLIRFKPNELTIPGYISLYLKSPYYWASIADNTIGVATPYVNATKLSKLRVPLPPINDQKRVVKKIEKLLVKITNTKSSLNQIPFILKRFRQSILSAACTGKLTKEWRKKNPDVEPASKLLERIKQERLKQYGNEVNKAKKDGSRPPKKPKNLEAVEIDTSDLPELPEGWLYTTLPNLVAAEKNSIKRGPFGSSIKKAYFVPSGYKVYEQGNAIYNDFNRGKYYINDEKYNELIDFSVKPGDLIVSCSGTIGRIAVVPPTAKKGIINQALLKLALDNKVVRTSFFIHLFNSFVYQSEIQKNARGSAMLNIAKVAALKAMLFPLPPIEEQDAIVGQIEAIFDNIDLIEKRYQEANINSSKIEQAILAKAFRGEL